jgi:hypothetical protein
MPVGTLSGDEISSDMRARNEDLLTRATTILRELETIQSSQVCLHGSFSSALGVVLRFGDSIRMTRSAGGGSRPLQTSMSEQAQLLTQLSGQAYNLEADLTAMLGDGDDAVVGANGEVVSASMGMEARPLWSKLLDPFNVVGKFKKATPLKKLKALHRKIWKKDDILTGLVGANGEAVGAEGDGDAAAPMFPNLLAWMQPAAAAEPAAAAVDTERAVLGLAVPEPATAPVRV